MADGDGRIDVAVVGVGRMGRHHARTYARNLSDRCRLVGVVDRDEERRETVADDFGGEPYADVASLLAARPGVRAVSIAVPTRAHAAAAGPLIDAGVACLIEKPLAETGAAARAIAGQADAAGVVLRVGHTERFNPAVRAVAGMGLTARFIEVDRVSEMSFRSLDVGVVMDMMIHDLDIVLMLARSPLKKVDAAGVAVVTDHEDICSARLVFESGCVANLTASRLALKTDRKLRVFSDTAYVSLDYAKRSGTLVKKTPGNVDTLKRVREMLGGGGDLSGMDYADLVEFDELTMDADGVSSDPLTAELGAFLDDVSGGGGGDDGVGGAEGVAAIEAAERVVQAVKAHRWEGLEVGALRV
ncbi:MAG: Gfo/Idh/MocA family oxidoreductase [Planctomycetota bacterium]